MPYDNEVKFLTQNETITFGIDFANWLDDGETISSITSIVSDPSGVTISNQTISGSTVLFQATSSTCNNYHIVATVVTSSNETLIARVNLRVR